MISSTNLERLTEFDHLCQLVILRFGRRSSFLGLQPFLFPSDELLEAFEEVFALFWISLSSGRSFGL